jgi:hypothetical protein
VGRRMLGRRREEVLRFEGNWERDVG